MSDSNSNSGSPLISLPVLVFGVFLTLKLAEIGQVADWSWWWVTSPLWIPFCLVLAIIAVFFTVFMVAAACGAKWTTNVKRRIR